MLKFKISDRSVRWGLSYDRAKIGILAGRDGWALLGETTVSPDIICLLCPKCPKLGVWISETAGPISMKFGMLLDPVGAFSNLKFQTDRFDGD